MNAARLYERASQAVLARADFIYLNERDFERFRVINERANQTANPLTMASDILELDGSLHYTVEQHMLVDPLVCKAALDAILSGVNDLGAEI